MINAFTEGGAFKVMIILSETVSFEASVTEKVMLWTPADNLRISNCNKESSIIPSMLDSQVNVNGRLCAV